MLVIDLCMYQLYGESERAVVVKAVGRGEGSGNKHLLSSFNVPGAISRALLGS